VRQAVLLQQQQVLQVPAAALLQLELLLLLLVLQLVLQQLVVLGHLLVLYQEQQRYCWGCSWHVMCLWWRAHARWALRHQLQCWLVLLRVQGRGCL
jgi:hypothetical protein